MQVTRRHARDARRLRQSSRLGAFLDPTADKLLMTACFVVLSIPDHPKSIPDFEITNHLPVYLTIVTISRDVEETVASFGADGTASSINVTFMVGATAALR